MPPYCRHVPSLAGLLLAGVTLAAWATPGRAAPEPAEIEKLIGQLGSDDRAQRDAAAKRLEEVGEPAVEPLRQAAAAKDADPDARLRAALVLRAITRGAYAELGKITGPTPGYWLNRVAFLPDGRHVVATGGALILYDVENGKEGRRVLERQVARNGLALSKDGTLFLTGHQKDNVVRLGEVESGAEVRTFDGHTAGVHGVALSPDGTLAASGGDDKTVRVWEVKTGKELRQAKGVTDQVRCLAFSPDGKRLASGHYGNKSEYLVRLWDVQTGEEVRSFKGHTKDVTAVRFLAEGRSLLSASLDGTLRLWDVEGGKELRRLDHAGGAYDAAVSPDGKRALSAGWDDKAVRLWELETGKELHRFEGHTARVLGVAFSPDGKRAVSSDAANTLRVWRLVK